MVLQQDPVEDFAKECARLNVQSVDLADPKEWPVYKKYGLVPTMIGGGTTISDGFNRKENHEGIAARFRESVDRGIENGAPSIIVFSGNRRGMSDEEGLENCVIGLKQVMPLAEDKNLLVCMELLNSKVGPQGLHVRSHQVGRRVGEAGWIAKLQTAV